MLLALALLGAGCGRGTATRRRAVETAATMAQSPPARATAAVRRRRWVAIAAALALLAAGCGRGTATQAAAVTVTASAADSEEVPATLTLAPVLGTEPPTLTATSPGPPTPTQTRVVTATWTPAIRWVTATLAPTTTAALTATATATATATLTGTLTVTGTAVVTGTATPASLLAVIAPGNVVSLTVVARAGPGVSVTETADITVTRTVTAGAALTPTPTATMTAGATLTPTATPTPTPAGLAARIDDAAWAADGRQVAIAGGFGVWVYDAAGGAVADPPRRAIDPESWATCAAISPDGAQVAVGAVDGLVWVYDLATGDLRVVLAGKTGRVEAVRWLSVPRTARPSGAVLASLNGGTVPLWDVAEQAHLGSLPPAPGAMLAVVGGDAPLVAVGAGATVRVWDVLELLGAEDPGAVPPWRVMEQPAPVTGLALSADGRRLAVGNTGGTIVLWNVVTAQRALTLVRLNAPAERLAFSPDGLLLASAHTDRQARLWAASNGALLRTLDAHADRITALAFAPDGRALLTAGWEGIVRVWGVRGEGEARE